MVHFKTFLQALTAGAIAVVGMAVAGPVWCGWLIMGIFLAVWAVNTRELRRLAREPCAVCGRTGIAYPRDIIEVRVPAGSAGDCPECGRPIADQH